MSLFTDDVIEAVRLRLREADPRWSITREQIHALLDAAAVQVLATAVTTVEVDGRVVVLRIPSEGVDDLVALVELSTTVRAAGAVTLLVVGADYDLSSLTLADIDAET